MKKIVLSAIAAILLTLGTHHVALLMGASEPTATATTVVAVAAFAAFIAFALAAAIAVAVALAAVLVVPGAAVGAVVVVALAAAFAAFAFASVVVAEERVRFRWAFGTYLVEGLAIWGALTVGSQGWSVAITLGGIAALIALWRAHERLAALDAPPYAALDHNGA